MLYDCIFIAKQIPLSLFYLQRLILLVHVLSAPYRVIVISPSVVRCLISVSDTISRHTVFPISRPL